MFSNFEIPMFFMYTCYLNELWTIDVHFPNSHIMARVHYHLECLDYCLHLHYYTHKVSADMPYGLLHFDIKHQKKAEGYIYKKNISCMTSESYIYINIHIYISSSCRAASTDIPDPLSPLLPIIHRLWQVFWATSRILT